MTKDPLNGLSLMLKEFMNIKGITNRHGSRMNLAMTKKIYGVRSEERVQRQCEIEIALV